MTKAPIANTSGANARRDLLSSRIAASTAASSLRRIASTSARPWLSSSARLDKGRSSWPGLRAVVVTLAVFVGGWRLALSFGLPPLGAGEKTEQNTRGHDLDEHDADQGECDAERAERHVHVDKPATTSDAVAIVPRRS